MNEEQVMHAMGIDDAYQVEHVLAEGYGSVTELVSIDGSGSFVRKKTPSKAANRGVWATLADCTSSRLPLVAATYEMPDCFVAVYDFIPGDTLEHTIAAHGCLKPAQAVEVLADVCEAVSDLHAHGIIHRDIAPGNIVMAADGAHLIDFGNARLAGQPGTGEEPPVGTWGFAAPEQYGFARTDERSDEYSLARLLGYLLSGKYPDDEGYGSALAIEGAGMPALRAVVEKGSAFEPSARYQDVGELREAAIRALSDADGDGDAAADASSFATSVSAGASDSADEPSDSTAASGSIDEPSDSAPGSRKRRGRLFAIGFAAILIAMLLLGVLVGRGGTGFSDGASDAVVSQEGEAALAGAAAEESSDGSAGDVADSTADTELSGTLAQASEALKLLESGWSVRSSGYVHYGFALRNESDDLAISYPGVTITGRDESGTVLFTEEQVLFDIQPGQTLYYGGLAGNGTAPATVEFKVSSLTDWQVQAPDDDAPMFSVSDPTVVSDGFGGTDFTGEVSLESGHLDDDGLTEVAVSVILRDKEGNIVFGETDFFDAPSSGGSVAFQVMAGDVPDYATAEAHAQAW